MQTLILTFVKKSYLDVFEGLGSWEYLYFILVFFKFVNEIFSSLSFFHVDYCLATISWCSLRVSGSIFLLDFFSFIFLLRSYYSFFFFFFFFKYRYYYSFCRFFTSIYNILTKNIHIWAFTFTTRDKLFRLCFKISNGLKTIWTICSFHLEIL